jgi:hypothetical protein
MNFSGATTGAFSGEETSAFLSSSRRRHSNHQPESQMILVVLQEELAILSFMNLKPYLAALYIKGEIISRCYQSTLTI